MVLFFCLASHSPTNNSLLTTAFTEPSNSTIRSTNFTRSVPTSRAEIRHKSEIEIEVESKQQQQLRNTFNNNISPVSTLSYPPVVRQAEILNNRSGTLVFDDNSFTTHYQIPKRRILTNSTHTQTPSVLLHQNDYQIQQVKAFNDETSLKNEKIHLLLRELTDCQVRIYQVCFFLLSSHYAYAAGVNLYLLFSFFPFYICYTGNNQTAGTTIGERQEGPRSIVLYRR
jgi:hypothetical protein